MTYDSIHNIVRKDQYHELKQPSGKPIEQKKTTYDWQYDYTGAQPHAPTHIGERTFSYDANGNQTGWEHDQNGTRRTIVWDEENRIQSIADNGSTATYKYNAAGERVIKRGSHGETVYVNQFFVIRNGSNATKNIFAGASRIVAKLVKQENASLKGKKNPKNKAPVEKDLYFYHPDHLGSTAYVTNAKGNVHQHLEYMPFGETFVAQSSGSQLLSYGFTGKELDIETGLYYFGARYYDPKTSVWLSIDPLWFKYPSWSPYNYAFHNPVGIIDPDGREGVVVTGNHEGKPEPAFLSKGLTRAKLLKDEGKNVTWYIPKDAAASYEERAEKYGIQVERFSKTQEIVDYVNNTNGNRKEDITDFDYIGHGSIGKLAVLPGDKIDISSFELTAFSEKAEFNFFACNSADKGPNGEPSVADKASVLTSGKIQAFKGIWRSYSTNNTTGVFAPTNDNPYGWKGRQITNGTRMPTIIVKPEKK
jgi:RHS repeat-associated protein